MRRSAKLALTAVAIYVSVSAAAAVLMVQLTLHPWRLPLPARTRIASMYAPYGADLQPVVIQAADGVELHAWYSVPEHQNGQSSHPASSELETIAVVSLVTVRRSCARAIAFCCPIRVLTASRVARLQPTAYAKETTFVDGLTGSTGKVPLASMVLVNRWGPPWCWKACVPSPGFARSLPNPLSPISAASPTIAKGISWELVALAWSELSEERSDSCPPSWVFSTPVGGMA